MKELDFSLATTEEIMKELLEKLIELMEDNPNDCYVYMIEKLDELNNGKSN